MDDDAATHHHHDKKIKLEGGEDIPKSEHAADNMKLEEEEKIPKSHDGTNTVNSKVPQPRQEYIIYVAYRVGTYLLATKEDPKSFFGSMLEEIGCSKTQITSKKPIPYYFLADLTPEEAKQVSEMDSVHKIRKYVGGRIRVTFA